MLRELYKDEIVKKLIDSVGYKNVMQVPRLLKVCVNVGISKNTVANKSIDSIANDLSLIAGQKAVVTHAKKSISGFSIREGDAIGCKVTLRKKQMYFFLERLLYTALPREKDFKGFRIRQLDGNGNLSFAVKEHVAFPEISYDNINNVFGMDITVVTSSVVDSDAKVLLSYLGFPFISSNV